MNSMMSVILLRCVFYRWFKIKNVVFIDKLKNLTIEIHLYYRILYFTVNNAIRFKKVINSKVSYTLSRTVMKRLGCVQLYNNGWFRTYRTTVNCNNITDTTSKISNINR